MEVAKKAIGIRLDENLIDMLDTVSQTSGSYFHGRNRTWLIEYAIRKTYADLTANLDIKEVDKAPA